MTDSEWGVERHVGSAASFHAREVPDPPRRVVWWFEVSSPAVALGSTQPVGIVDAARAADRGVEVVRRRSGGGAVWLDPASVTWVDVVLPASDGRWIEDVSRSALWLGEIWAECLEALGVAGATVHRGPMETTVDSSLVCFAGRAPGEVMVGGRKVVGVSQRRTRGAARFQCALLHRWDPGPLVEVLALSGLERTDLVARLVGVAAGVGDVEPQAVVAELIARLRSS